MSMKKIWSLMLASAMAVSMLAGCGSTTANTTANNSSTAADSASKTASASGSAKIALCMSARDQFLSTLEGAALAEGKTAGVTVNSFDANNDAITQLNQVTTAVNDGYNCIIVNLVSTDNAQEIINAAGKTPLVFVNRTPANTDKTLVKDKIVYVGSDETEAGKMEGDYVAGVLKKAGKTEANIVVLTGTLGMQATTLRTDSAKKALEASGLKINYVLEDTADWDRATAMNKFVQFLGTNKPFDGVVCNNDEMALGAIEAMKTTGDGKIKVPVAGVDATAVALQSIKNGEQAFSAFQNAKGQGAGAVDAAVKLAKGESCDALTWIPFEPVTKDTVDKYLTK